MRASLGVFAAALAVPAWADVPALRVHLIRSGGEWTVDGCEPTFEQPSVTHLVPTSKSGAISEKHPRSVLAGYEETSAAPVFKVLIPLATRRQCCQHLGCNIGHGNLGCNIGSLQTKPLALQLLTAPPPPMSPTLSPRSPLATWARAASCRPPQPSPVSNNTKGGRLETDSPRVEVVVPSDIQNVVVLHGGRTWKVPVPAVSKGHTTSCVDGVAQPSPPPPPAPRPACSRSSTVGAGAHRACVPGLLNGDETSADCGGSCGTVCPEHITWQLSGPTSTQPNLIFLSAGFLESEKSLFEAKVQECLNAIGDAVPFSLFRRTFNFFSVFIAEAGPNSGVTVAVCCGGDVLWVAVCCGVLWPWCAVEVQTCRCSFGDDVTSPARALVCDRSLMLSYGATAPAAVSEMDVVIALVNDEVNRGGTGGGGILSVWIGDDMSDVLIHELGHAWGELADEYDYGYSQGGAQNLHNCVEESQTGEPAFWEPWVGCRPTTSTSFDLLYGTETFVYWNQGSLPGLCGDGDDAVTDVAASSSPCSYTNYRKPTQYSCIMKGPELVGQEVFRPYDFCPVCREAMLAAVMLVNSPTPRTMGWLNPQCPLEAEITELSEDPSSGFNNVTLSVNPDLADLVTLGLTITWTSADLPENLLTSFADSPDLVVSAADLTVSTGVEVIVLATISFLECGGLARSSEMVALFANARSTTFTIKSVATSSPPPAPVAPPTSPPPSGSGSVTSKSHVLQASQKVCATSGVAYYSTCKSGSLCDIDVSLHDYQEPARDNGDEKSWWESWLKPELLLPLLIVLGIFCCLFCVWQCVAKACRNKVGKGGIEKPSCCLRSLLGIIKALLCLLVVAIVLLAVLAVWYFDETGLELLGEKYGVYALSVLLTIIFVFLASNSRITISVACILMSLVLLLATAIAIALLVLRDDYDEIISFTNSGTDTLNGTSIDPFESEGYVISDSTTARLLRSLWEREVEDDPGLVCNLELRWECSGFDPPGCIQIPVDQSTAQCPADCPEGNSSPASCYLKMSEVIKDNFLLLSVVMWVSALLLLVATVLMVQPSLRIAVGLDSSAKKRSLNMLQGTLQLIRMDLAYPHCLCPKGSTTPNQQGQLLHKASNLATTVHPPTPMVSPQRIRTGMSLAELLDLGNPTGNSQM
eukprot:gene796-389_t